MYEFTWGGWWFNWSALDRPSRRLAAGSFAFSFFAAVPLGFMFGRAGYSFGRCVGSGDWSPCEKLNLTVHPALAILITSCAIISAWLWMRFSARQDEMFNRVQNWSIGMAGAWTAAAILVWTFMALGGLLPHLAA